MIALLICLAGGVAALVAGRRSLGAGCLVVLSFGYAYGILRANLSTVFSHFIFDSALVGFYASQFLMTPNNQGEKPQNYALRTWLIILMIWPLLLVFLPLQPLSVSIVGLRGNIFLLPLLLLGSRLRSSDLRTLAIGLAALNLVALAFGVAEYFKGLDHFFPYGPVTANLYNTRDGAGLSRIPATFANAHTYGATMIDTVPFMFGYWVQRTATSPRKILLLLGIASSFFGVLLASTRLGMIGAAVIVLVAVSGSRLGSMKRWTIALIIGAVIVAAIHNERWQRYRELDTDTVIGRIAGSVNRSFLEILVEYPMGNGLGGGGTSVPYFLESQVNRSIEVENEYSRILLEQGVIGLLIWLGFVVWFLTNRSAFVRDAWFVGRRMAWWLCAFSLISAVIGNGLLTAIPCTFLLLLAMGWASARPQTVAQTPRLFVAGEFPLCRPSPRA